MAARDPELASAAEPSENYLPEPEAGREGMALCLSGGGYRAALFHLGVLRRLNELGTLGRVDTVSAVSGGSILAAFLAQRVRPWPAPGERIDDFDALADEFRGFTRKNIRRCGCCGERCRGTGSTPPWRSTASSALDDLGVATRDVGRGGRLRVAG